MGLCKRFNSALGTPVDLYIDFASGSNGDPVTVANLGAGSHGTYGEWYLTDDPMQGSKITTVNGFPLGGSVIVGGTTYTDTTSPRGFAYNHLTLDEYAYAGLGAARAVVSMGFNFSCGLDPSTYRSKTLSLLKDIGGHAAALNIETDNLGYLRPRLETSSGVVATSVELPPGDEVWVTIKFDSSNNLATLMIHDPFTWGQLGSTVTLAIDAAVSGATRLEIGEDSGHGETEDATDYYGKVLVDWTTAACPLLPGV